MKQLYKKQKLERILLIWLDSIMIAAFLTATVIGLFLQNKMQQNHVFSIMNGYLNDHTETVQVVKTTDKYINEWIDVLNGDYGTSPESYLDNEHLASICQSNSRLLCEMNIIDENGIVAYSSNPDMIGFDLRDSERTAHFLRLLEGETSISDDISKNPFNDEVKIVYFGRAFRDKGGFMLAGINEENYNNRLLNELEDATEDFKIGVSGYFIACDLDRNIVTATHTMDDIVGEEFTDEALLPENDGEIRNTITTLYEKNSYVSALKASDYYVIGVYPVAEADRFKLQNNIIAVILFFSILSVFFITFFIVIKRRVIKDVEKTHASLKLITDGDLDEKVDVTGSLEFAELSDGINETVDKLKGLIREEDERVKTELQNAKNIQESAVPREFPSDERFELYASMDTAEAVGGDFYDFFMINDNTLAVVMADVSGKGMPAALYMMRAKTLIKTYSEQGLSIDEVAIETNKRLCEDASRDMFVTAWIGFLDLTTGVMSFVHAGHTFPILLHEGEASFVKQKINMVLGGLKKAKYIKQEITLSPGDAIYLYTDGVPEARNTDNEMYEEDRLITFISKDISGEAFSDDFCRKASEAILSDVKRFAAEALQFDDITMMWVKYNGKK